MRYIIELIGWWDKVSGEYLGAQLHRDHSALRLFIVYQVLSVTRNIKVLSLTGLTWCPARGE